MKSDTKTLEHKLAAYEIAFQMLLDNPQLPHAAQKFLIEAAVTNNEYADLPQYQDLLEKAVQDVTDLLKVLPASEDVGVEDALTNLHFTLKELTEWRKARAAVAA